MNFNMAIMETKRRVPICIFCCTIKFPTWKKYDWKVCSPTLHTVTKWQKNMNWKIASVFSNFKRYLRKVVKVFSAISNYKQHNLKLNHSGTQWWVLLTKNCPAILLSNPLMTESKGRVNWTLCLLSAKKAKNEVQIVSVGVKFCDSCFYGSKNWKIISRGPIILMGFDEAILLW